MKYNKTMSNDSTLSEDIYKAFLHAETVGQARLNNFLMTGTIVLVGCAISLQIDTPVVGPSVSIALATLGIFFSRMWYYLGCRQRLYHHYVEWHMDSISESHSDSQEINSRVRDFHDVLLPEIGNDISDHCVQYSSRKLLTVVPRYFIVTYAFIWVVSWVPFLADLHELKRFESVALTVVILALTACWVYYKLKTEIILMLEGISATQLETEIKNIMEES